MADLTLHVLARNTGVKITEEAGAASQTIPMSGYPDDIFLSVRNTDAATATINFVAATQRGAWMGVQGNISQDVAQNEEFLIGPMDGARFKDGSEDITVTITDDDGTAYSGTVTNVLLAAIVQAK